MRNNDAMSRAAAKLFGVGGPSVRPYRVGGTSVRPYRVGAPAVRDDQPQQPVLYGEEEWVAGGNSYFGLGRHLIAAGERNVSITCNPIRPFTPLALRCPSTQTGLYLSQIDIQGVQFFANQPRNSTNPDANLGAPIEAFSEVTTLPGFEMITIQPDTGVTFTVSNPGATDRYFAGVLYGTQVRK